MLRLFLIIAAFSFQSGCLSKVFNPMEAFQYRELSYAEAVTVVPDFTISESEYDKFMIAEIKGKIDFLDLDKNSQFSIRADNFCIRGIFMNWGEYSIDPTPYDGGIVTFYGSMEGGADSLRLPDPTVELVGGYPVQSKIASDVSDCDDFFAGFLGLKIDRG